VPAPLIPIVGAVLATAARAAVPAIVGAASRALPAVAGAAARAGASSRALTTASRGLITPGRLAKFAAVKAVTGTIKGVASAGSAVVQGFGNQALSQSQNNSNARQRHDRVSYQNRNASTNY
jgi:hypothetical protein